MHNRHQSECGHSRVCGFGQGLVVGVVARTRSVPTLTIGIPNGTEEHTMSESLMTFINGVLHRYYGPGGCRVSADVRAQTSRTSSLTMLSVASNSPRGRPWTGPGARPLGPVIDRLGACAGHVPRLRLRRSTPADTRRHSRSKSATRVPAPRSAQRPGASPAPDSDPRPGARPGTSARGGGTRSATPGARSADGRLTRRATHLQRRTGRCTAPSTTSRRPDRVSIHSSTE